MASDGNSSPPGGFAALSVQMASIALAKLACQQLAPLLACQQLAPLLACQQLAPLLACQQLAPHCRIRVPIEPQE